MGTVSTRNGKEHFAFGEHAFNGDDFAAFLRSLHAHMGTTRYFVVLDNCRIHIVDQVKAVQAELGIRLVFVQPYSPWFNACELHWADAKRRFRGMQTHALMECRPRDLMADAKLATFAVADAACRRFCDNALRQIR